MTRRMIIIKEALECNNTQALVYSELLKEISGEDLIDFFKFRLNFIEQYTSKELATKKALIAYKQNQILNALASGIRVFNDKEQMINFIKTVFKGKDFCYGAKGYRDFVIFGLDESGEILNKYAIDNLGRFVKLNSDESAEIYNWLFENQHRIGVIKHISKAEIDKIAQAKKIAPVNNNNNKIEMSAKTKNLLRGTLKRINNVSEF